MAGIDSRTSKDDLPQWLLLTLALLALGAVLVWELGELGVMFVVGALYLGLPTAWHWRYLKSQPENRTDP